MQLRASCAECSSSRSPYRASYRIARKILVGSSMNERLWSTRSSPARKVHSASERIEEPAERGGLQRHGHGVDREIATEEILAQPGAFDGRERPRRVVELGARRDHVDSVALPVEDDRRAELPVRRDAASERCGERARELDRIAFDRDVDVEPLLAEKDVADGAADEVDGLGAIAERRHRIEQHTQALDALELDGKALTRLLAIVSMPSSARRRSTRATTPTSSASLTTATRPSSASVTSTRSSESVAFSVVVAARPLMTPPYRRVREPVGDRLVEILATHRPDDAAVLGDEHSALSVALTTPSRRGRSAPARLTVEAST